ncbi:MAG: hypothetical protein ACK4WC_13840 [Rubrimonas sp.]
MTRDAPDPRFPPGSRYHDVPARIRLRADGSAETYLARRILPAPERHVAMARLRVAGGERPDALAEAAYGDPDLWWRIADAHHDDDPAGLAHPPGRLLTIPLPLEVADGDA